MWKRIWLVTIAALALFSFASSRSYAQYGFGINPESLVLSPGESYMGVYGWLVNIGTDPVDIQFTAFNDGLVAVGVTVDTRPFYDWVVTLDDLTLRLEPWMLCCDDTQSDRRHPPLKAHHTHQTSTTTQKLRCKL
jgi:hypothetical protein